jgi:hypothetical protein
MVRFLTSYPATADYSFVKARPPFPDLSQTLCDSAATDSTSTAAAAIQRLPPDSSEKRIHTRFDKAFLVVIGSELYGDTHAIARNVSAGGILVEMCYAPPMGTMVTVHFRHLRDDDRIDEIVARAEVKHHHYLNFTGGSEGDSARAVGMRFFEFVDVPAPRAGDLLH